MPGNNLSPRGQQRVLRACDLCTHSKQRCDGQHPCRRCADRDEPCHYAKTVRKRGRRPRLDSDRNIRRESGISEGNDSPRTTAVIPQDIVTSRNESVPDMLGFSPIDRRLHELDASTGDIPHINRSKTPGTLVTTSPSFTTSSHRVSLDSILSENPLNSTQLKTPQTTIAPGHVPMNPGDALHFHQDVFDDIPNTLPNQGRFKQPHRCLDTALPYIQGILTSEEASEMLEIYFNEDQNPLFKSTSPYMLAHVLHPSSVLHPIDPRPTSATLLVVILYCVTQTADMKIFDPPGARERMSVALYRLSLDLLQREDPDNYFRTSDGWQYHHPYHHNDPPGPSHRAPEQQANGKGLLPRQLGSTDTILAVAILMLVISGGNYKADALKWRDKLFRLVRASGLSMEDQDIDLGPVFCGLYNGDATFKRWFIAKEERRRLFWLVYCLDRHLALSFNLRLSLPEGTFCVRNPLPESLWRSLDKADLNSIPPCSLGPPTRISGIGFFEYFLPLAGVLGHIIDLHHFRNHPTLGEFVSLDGIRCIETMIGQREQELAELESQAKLALGEPSAKLRLVKTYSTYLLHVFYILLHGKWDPISMIEDKDDWITSERFVTCASHALSATGVVSQILALDPEMVFMPYLFGIYLLQGSFILLLFVDRMPELGPNRSVEDVCETIIRAHEVSVVTLDTTFQKNFRKVFRSMLYDAQQAGPHSWDEHKARRRELLSLYRWTPMAHGLAY